MFSVSKVSSNDGGGRRGGGGKQASCLVAKQAVEFAQVLASPHNYTGLSIAVTGSKCPEHIHKS